MTQAMALSAMLRANGHEVVRAVVGRSERRSIPDFFLQGIGTQVSQVDSPNFVTDKDSKSVNLGKSIRQGFARLGTYRRSIRELHRMVEEDQPDVIINFYDFIGGIYHFLKRPKARFVTIAHQYLAGHPVFEFPEGQVWDKYSLTLGNWLTALGADQRLALSFKEYPDEGKVTVVPPLLRQEVKALEPSEGKHMLVYMLNHGYASEVEAFHEEFPQVPLHCFWDKPDAPAEWKVDETLTFHRLDGEKFLRYMASCRGYLTTAGFESVCEAMYLGKPVMMMPVHGHYEQACNALDAVKSGAGVSSTTFDLRILHDYIPKHQDVGESFRNWCDRAEGIFLENLTDFDRKSD